MKTTKWLLRSGLSILCAIAVWLFSAYIDFPPANESQTKAMVLAAFEYSGPVQKTYFRVYGLLQGCICYYRFEATDGGVQQFLATKGLVEIERHQASITRFIQGTPYWWHPQFDHTTRFYAYSLQSPCVFSWDSSTRQCFLKLDGG